MEKRRKGETHLKTEYTGKLRIGSVEMPCAVLNDEKRVFWQREMVYLLTGNKKGGFERYLKATNLQAYVPEKYRGENWKSNVIIFEHQGRPAYGYEAEDLIDICYMYINADRDKKLQQGQKHLAEQAHIIVKAFAKTGVIAVIDEVTGYQNIKKREALQIILDKFLSKELSIWAKRFPDEFYKEIFRLKNWPYDPKSVKKPSIIGKYTNDVVYARLAPGILEELRKRNPTQEDGTRKARHHQYLTVDIGHPTLAHHLYAVIGLMRASKTWDEFYKLLQRSFPKYGDKVMLENFSEEI